METPLFISPRVEHEVAATSKTDRENIRRRAESTKREPPQQSKIVKARTLPHDIKARERKSSARLIKLRVRGATHPSSPSFIPAAKEVGIVPLVPYYPSRGKSEHHGRERAAQGEKTSSAFEYGRATRKGREARLISPAN